MLALSGHRPAAFTADPSTPLYFDRRELTPRFKWRTLSGSNGGSSDLNMALDFWEGGSYEHCRKLSALPPAIKMAF